MLKRFLFFIGISLVFLPATAFMANVGFVPSTGVWFSTTTFNPKEVVRVYTVVINNDYQTLDGTVGFYDNDQLVDSVDFKALTKESAQQLRIFWQPIEGAHIVQARFIRINTLDVSGQKNDIALNSISNVSGLPLVVGFAAVNVASSGGKLVMAPQVLGEKIKVNEQIGETRQTSPTTSDDQFSKNHDLFDKAQGMATTITTTAGKISDAYNQTKSIIEQGQAYYEVGKEKIAAAQPYFVKAKKWWFYITDNNNPKHLVIGLGVVVFLWVLTKLFRRRRRYDDFE